MFLNGFSAAALPLRKQGCRWRNVIVTGRRRQNQPRVKVLPPRLAFTPTQPKATSRQLTGRQAELRRILQAIGEDRAHVVLYSERGRGKTSLSNMVVESLRPGRHDRRPLHL